MKVSTTTVIGLLAGFAIGIVGLGRVSSISPDLANVASKIHQYTLWIVLLTSLVPLADYFVSTVCLQQLLASWRVNRFVIWPGSSRGSR
ncbi:MAG: hypothetical protein ABSA92_07495 [Candidatus Bathyarchaeia archaeon]|jgi:hypothetical protein